MRILKASPCVRQRSLHPPRSTVNVRTTLYTSSCFGCNCNVLRPHERLLDSVKPQQQQIRLLSSSLKSDSFCDPISINDSCSSTPSTSHYYLHETRFLHHHHFFLTKNLETIFQKLSFVRNAKLYLFTQR